MGILLVQPELFAWVLVIVVGLPLTVILLGEVAARLERRGNPLAQMVRLVRHIVAPLLAIFLVVWQLLEIDRTEPSVRLLETLLWMALMVAGLIFISNLVQLGKRTPGAWTARVPGLFFALGRALILFFVVYYVLTTIWGINVSSLITAVGVGSLVVALALQDTLSSLVSGFLLVLDRPFEVGDYVKIGEWEGQVTDLNWRAVRLHPDDLTTVVIPNSSLSGQAVLNYTQMTPQSVDWLFFSFSYDDLPNKVHRVLREVASSFPEIVDIVVRTRSFDDFSIRYQLIYEYKAFKSISYRNDLRSHVTTRVYYAAKRHGLTIPYPIASRYNLEETRQLNLKPDMQRLLRGQPFLETLDGDLLAWMAAGTRLAHYGVGEQIVRQGEPDEGLYIVQQGQVTLSVAEADDDQQVIGRLTYGDVFGEMVSLRGESSPVTATVAEDASILVVDHGTFRHLVERNHHFAMQINALIESRKSAIHAAERRETVDVRTNGRARPR